MYKIALPLIFIAGAIATFVFFTNGTYAETKELNVQLQSISDALNKVAQLRQIRDKLAIDRNKISELDLARISKMLPDGVENIGLIIEMNNIARDKGMELLDPSIGEVTTGAGVGPENKKFGSLKMTFKVVSTYERFIEFTQELERSLRLVDVVGIKFGAPDDKTGRSTYEVEIQTYWLK